MHRYNLMSEISGDKYRQLLQLALNKKMVVLLVDVGGHSPTAKAPFLNAMAPHLISMSMESAWPGTILTPGRAPVYRYALNKDSFAAFLKFASGLLDWKYPNLLEDFCLLRPNGSALMTSTTSEKDVYFDLSEMEYSELCQAIPDIKLVLEDRTPENDADSHLGKMTFQDRRFDFNDAANTYIRNQLRNGNSLAVELLKQCSLENGRTHAYLPADANDEAAYKFDVGGIVTRSKYKNAQIVEQIVNGQRWKPSRNGVIHAVPLIYKWLMMHPATICIIEDAVSNLGDPCLEQVETAMLSYGKEIYHWVRSEDASPDIIESVLLSGQSWRSIWAVSSSPKDLHGMSKELTKMNIEMIARETTMLIVGAYDGEGYLVWESDVMSDQKTKPTPIEGN